MKMNLLKKIGAITALCTVLAAGSARAQDLIYGFGGSGFNPASLSLVSFNSATPGTVNTIGSITGISTGFALQGIDFRPATGQLYGLAYDGNNLAQLYTLNTATAVATAVGSQFAIGSATGGFGLSIGIGFNPSVDLLRVVTGTNGNFRVNPTTGAIVTTGGADGGLAYASGDPNASNSYQIADGDYLGGNLYDIDYINNVLVRQNPPNNGTLNTIGGLGITLVNGTRSTGFDISPNGTAYLTGNPSTDGGAVRQRLYTVNLTSGAATSVGLVGSDANFNLIDIAVVPEPSSWLLICVGVVMLGIMVVRRKRTA